MASHDQYRLCPHCSTVLTRHTFYAHKRRYYDSSTQKWMQKQCGQELPLKWTLVPVVLSEMKVHT